VVKSAERAERTHRRFRSVIHDSNTAVFPDRIHPYVRHAPCLLSVYRQPIREKAAMDRGRPLGPVPQGAHPPPAWTQRRELAAKDEIPEAARRRTGGLGCHRRPDAPGLRGIADDEGAALSATVWAMIVVGGIDRETHVEGGLASASYGVIGTFILGRGRHMQNHPLADLITHVKHDKSVARAGRGYRSTAELSRIHRRVRDPGGPCCASRRAEHGGVSPGDERARVVQRNPG
jgi:hypothetical protein